MENGLVFRFEKKELEGLEDYIFCGMRMTEDVMMRFCYLLSEFLAVDKSIVQIQDDEGVDSYVVDSSFLSNYDEIEDEEDIEDNIFDS